MSILNLEKKKKRNKGKGNLNIATLLKKNEIEKKLMHSIKFTQKEERGQNCLLKPELTERSEIGWLKSLVLHMRV